MAMTFTCMIVADLADVADAGDVAVGQFADVAEAVFAGQDFDERTEVLDAADAAVVDLADLDGLGQALRRDASSA